MAIIKRLDGWYLAARVAGRLVKFNIIKTNQIETKIINRVQYDMMNLPTLWN